MSQKLSKELEALEKINHTLCLNSHRIEFGVDEDNIDCKNVEEFVECYNITRKYLKALQIIIEKNVQIGALKYWNRTYKGKLTYQTYLDILEDCELGGKLTEEEFELVIEVVPCTMKD